MNIIFEKNLLINSEKEIVSPMTQEEQKFCTDYLSNSPVHQKKLLHYDLIQYFAKKWIDALNANFDNIKSQLEIDGKSYEFIDLTRANNFNEYQLLGCAGRASNVTTDYQGYGENRWRYLATSLTDQNHSFYGENREQVFQILSFPAIDIIKTENRDAGTPESSQNQSPWYAMHKRLQVLSCYIDELYQKCMMNSLVKLRTPLDRLIHLNILAEKWTEYILISGMERSLEIQDKYAEVINILRTASLRCNKRQVYQALKNLDPLHFSAQDILEIVEIVEELRKLEMEYPEFALRNNEYDYNYDIEIKLLKQEINLIIASKGSKPYFDQALLYLDKIEYIAVLNKCFYYNNLDEESSFLLKKEIEKIKENKIEGLNSELLNFCFKKVSYKNGLFENLVSCLTKINESKNFNFDDAKILQLLIKEMGVEEFCKWKQKGVQAERAIFYNHCFDNVNSKHEKDFNRVGFQIKSMENFCSSTDEIKKYLSFVPECIELVKENINRFLGPQELLSQTATIYNELNIDVTLGKQLHVMAFLFPKKMIESDQFITKDDVKQIFECGINKKIPIILR